MKMKKKLQILTICFTAIAVLVILFPFRTAQFKYGKVDSSASLGPSFIFTDPGKPEIYKAVFGKPLSETGGFGYASALRSEIDYGRTLLLVVPFAFAAVASFFWMRKSAQ